MRYTAPANCRAVVTKCRQKQYHGLRQASQFVVSLLHDAGSRGVVHHGAMELSRALQGVPPTVEHEGPLSSCHLGAFTSICEGELVRAFQTAFSDELEAPPSTHVAEMWPLTLQEHYTKELVRTRLKASGTPATPQRFEAGLVARRVFGLAEAGLPLPRCDVTFSKRWLDMIDAYTLFLPDRSPQHELENLPQEIGIGELLADIISCCEDGRMDVQTVLDVGGGNGFLAAQLAEQFECKAIVVDTFTPRHAIDNDSFPHWTSVLRCRMRVPRRFSLVRIPQRLEHVDWSSTKINPDTCVLVAKHLCGTTIDKCLRCLHDCNRLPRVLVVIPCCFNKGCYSEYCNPVYLGRVAGIGSEEAWSRCTRLTDWNRSTHQVQPSLPLELCGSAAHCKAQPCWTCSAHHGKKSKKSLSHLIPCMNDVAVLMEAVINHGRVKWLREIGYESLAVQYVPRCVTPKNRAIVGMRTDHGRWCSGARISGVFPRAPEPHEHVVCRRPCTKPL
ncbi:tRNA guanosine-2-O-methyltransferase TRM13 [Trypanosoma vivax]|nr:tRNA guanosine-2-O-methyltransferase TRM13 [Trypanosoma vivax]